MSKRSPRLLFTDEELAAPELKKAIRKADKRMKKLEKAEAKIPKKTVKKKQRVVDPKTGTVTTRLSFEEVDKKRPPSKLTHAFRFDGLFAERRRAGGGARLPVFFDFADRAAQPDDALGGDSGQQRDYAEGVEP